MRCHYSCGSEEHLIARRRFLGGMAAGAGLLASGGLTGLGFLTRAASASTLSRNQKRVLLVYMHGGLSQLESWDPKPGTSTGGPFRAIPTSVPGLQISELLPMTARQMHHLALVRGVNTKEDDHGKGQYLMITGRRQTPAANYPHVGAVMAKALTPADSPVPGHIQITPGGGGGRTGDAAYLGPQYAAIQLGNGNPPQNSGRPNGLTPEFDQHRQHLRRAVNDSFAMRRRTAMSDAYTATYEQALQLMERKEIFDVSKESVADQDRYGKHDFGRHCLLARRLLENGATFVQVSHSNYDTHSENFDFHIEQLGEFDRPFATLVDDLAQRGLLDSTLIVVMSEFGRTPNINQYYGRDHFSAAWSVLLGGAGLKRGIVHGKTDAKGTAVVDGQADGANLFHTYLASLGLNSQDSFDVGGRKMPMADPSAAPISELLA
jgi:uncharacterized protein (DUF1501 family)